MIQRHERAIKSKRDVSAQFLNKFEVATLCNRKSEVKAYIYISLYTWCLVLEYIKTKYEAHRKILKYTL